MRLAVRVLCLLGWHDPTDITSYWDGRLIFRRTQCRHCSRKC